MADIIDLVYADHDWFRRQFFLLDDAKSDAELAAIWDALGDRLDVHAEAEEAVFYPALLKHGGSEDRGNPEGDPEDETEDAITDPSFTRTQAGHRGMVRRCFRSAQAERRTPRRGRARGDAGLHQERLAGAPARVGVEVAAVLCRS